MIKLPLKYSRVPFANALVDDDNESFQQLDYLSVTLPRSIRKLTARPDVILALLQEDESVRRRCIPFVSFGGTQVQLCHMVLRPELADFIIKRIDIGVVRGGGKHHLDSLRASIGRVVHANLDRTDCRRDNLREL